MKRWIGAALVACVTVAHAQSTPAKKELVAKFIQLQQPGVEGLARGLAERPAVQLMQAASMAIQQQVPPEKRDALGKQLEAEAKKFVEESIPTLRERATKLAPTILGPAMEEKFSEDELKQLIAWYESPVNKKYQQLAPEMQGAFTQKLVAEAAPIIDPKLQALQQSMRTMLVAAAAPTDMSASRPQGKAPAAAPRPARAASK